MTGNDATRNDAAAAPGADGALDADGVLALVRATMDELGLCAAEVSPTAELFDELDLDSLDWVDLATRLEELLPLSLRDESLEGIRTVGDVAQRVHARLVERGGARA